MRILLAPNALPVRRRRRGFTLVELLVASAILAILSSLVFLIAANMAELWKQSSQRLGARSAGELALDLLERDLTALVAADGRWQWMQIVMEDGTGPAGPVSNPHLLFFAHQPGSSGGGSGTAAVSYRLGYRDPFAAGGGGNHRRPGLYRAVLDPEQTFRQIWMQPPQADLKTLVWDRIGALPGELESGWAVDIREWSLDTANLLATPVARWSLALHYQDEEGQPAVLRMGPEGGRRLAVSTHLEVDGDRIPFRRLVALEVELTVLTREGMQRLDSYFLQNGVAELPAELLERIWLEDAEIVIRRIAFSGSLR